MSTSVRAGYFSLFFTLIMLVGVLFFNVQNIVDAHTNLTPASLETAALDAIQISPAPISIPENISIAPIEIQAPVEPVVPAVPVGIQAKSALSVQIGETGNTITFEKDSEVRLPIASLTKLMTALVALKNYDLDARTVVTKNAMAEIGEQGVLKEGDYLSVKNLLYITLMESSNRATYALSEIMGPELFVSKMNQQAQDLGLTSTHFQDSAGLDVLSYSTVKDLAMLTQYLFEKYPLFKEIISLKEYYAYLDNGQLHHKLETTNKLLGQDGIIGGKTGFTNEARGCMMTITQNTDGTNSINIILGSEDRFLDMSKLLKSSRGFSHADKSASGSN